MRWVTDFMSLTCSSKGNINGCVPLSRVIGETPDVSECLDFGFYDRIWCIDNAGLGPKDPGR